MSYNWFEVKVINTYIYVKASWKRTCNVYVPIALKNTKTRNSNTNTKTLECYRNYFCRRPTRISWRDRAGNEKNWNTMATSTKSCSTALTQNSLDIGWTRNDQQHEFWPDTEGKEETTTQKDLGDDINTEMGESGLEGNKCLNSWRFGIEEQRCFINTHDARVLCNSKTRQW